LQISLTGLEPGKLAGSGAWQRAWLNCVYGDVDTKMLVHQLTYPAGQTVAQLFVFQLGFDHHYRQFLAHGSGD